MTSAPPRPVRWRTPRRRWCATCPTRCSTCSRRLRPHWQCWTTSHRPRPPSWTCWVRAVRVARQRGEEKRSAACRSADHTIRRRRPRASEARRANVAARLSSLPASAGGLGEVGDAYVQPIRSSHARSARGDSRSRAAGSAPPLPRDGPPLAFRPTALLGQLWPFFRHPIEAVRRSVLATVLCLLGARGGAPVAPDVVAELLAQLFQTMLIEQSAVCTHLPPPSARFLFLPPRSC